MNNLLLHFSPVVGQKDLVSSTVYDAINDWKGPQDKKDFLVAEIDPKFAGGIELCEKYNIDSKNGANCLIVVGIQNDKKTYAACLVPVGYKYDINGVVKKTLNVRRVSVAPLDYILSQIKMEYGSITPIGLPKDWFIFIDPLVLKSERIIIGSGLRKSKLSIPSAALLSLPNAAILKGLAKLDDKL